jgi:two-component system response regulator (stage 0 sporulation protein F)
VLVADDDATVRSVLARALAQLPVRATFCADGTEALHAFRARPDAFAVVLLDMMMPGLNGDEVFRAIADERPATPVVLMSGYAEQEVVARLPGRTLAGYLHKPFQLDDLFHLLDRLLPPAPAP